jgi:hypothetical protein
MGCTVDPSSESGYDSHPTRCQILRYLLRNRQAILGRPAGSYNRYGNLVLRLDPALHEEQYRWAGDLLQALRIIRVDHSQDPVPAVLNLFQLKLEIHCPAPL